MSTDKTNQSWGGRFSEPVDAFVARFTASVNFDQRLYRHDIMGSIAHASMLAKVGVLTDAERDQIIANLKDIQSEIEAGTFDWRVDLEDVHMNIEARLTDRIGVTGKKLHTGRSRPYTATFCRSRPSASATTSPMRSAVPEGASTLCR